MKPSRCVFTVVVGGFEELLDQPCAQGSEVDFICFTDSYEAESATWQTRLFKPRFPSDNARSSRWPKINPHLFLPEYEESLYIDASVRLRQKPEVIFEDLLPPGVGLTAMAHAYRDSVRDEFVAVKEGDALEAPWVLAEQLSHYEKHYPNSLEMKPLNGGFLLRRHKRPDVIRAMEIWYSHVLRYSRRDQLSFRIALQEAGLSPNVVELDIRDNKYSQWPVRSNRRRELRGELPKIPELEVLGSELEQVRRDLKQAKSEVADLTTQLADARDSRPPGNSHDTA